MKPFLLVRFLGDAGAQALLKCAEAFPRLWRVPRFGVLLDGTQLAQGLVPEDAEIRTFFSVEKLRIGRGPIVELAFLASFGFSGDHIWTAPLRAWIYAFIDPLNAEEDREKERVEFLRHAASLEWRSIMDLLEVPRSTLGARFGERWVRFHAQVTRARQNEEWRTEVLLPSPWRRQIWEARFVPDVALGSALDWELFGFEFKRVLDPLVESVRRTGWDLLGLEMEWSAENFGGKLEIPFGVPQRESPQILRILIGALQRDWQEKCKHYEGDWGGWPTVWLRVREPEHVVSAGRGQRDIFTRDVQSQESLEELSSRMRAKFGADSLLQARVRDGYFPEERIERQALQSVYANFSEPVASNSESYGVFLNTGNPAFLFQEPIPLSGKTLRWNVVNREGPERYELRDHPGQPLRIRDYWIWELADARMMWVYSDGIEMYWHGVFETS